VIANAFPERGEQARAIGIWAGIGSVALAAGPLLGGALVDGIGWRAVFFINAPIVVAAFAAAAAVVEESTDPQGRRLDAAGVAFAALTLAAIIFAIIEAGHGHVVVVAVIVAGAIVGLAALGALIAIERAHADPMLPLDLFRRADFSAANAIAGAMNCGTLGLLFVLTLYLQRVQGR
jgi:DHA2 family methylenomycin A resistance protein-like MFS transporter